MPASGCTLEWLDGHSAAATTDLLVALGIWPSYDSSSAISVTTETRRNEVSNEPCLHCHMR